MESLIAWNEKGRRELDETSVGACLPWPLPEVLGLQGARAGVPAPVTATSPRLLALPLPGAQAGLATHSLSGKYQGKGPRWEP